MALVRSRSLGGLLPRDIGFGWCVRRPLLATVVLSSALACEATPDGAPPLPSDITLETADNYTVTLTLAIPELAIDPVNPTFDWSGIVDNLRGESVAAADITLLTLARFDNDTQENITRLLESGQGVSSAADAAGKFVPTAGVTTASLADFESTTNAYEGKIPVADFFGVPGTYLLSFAKGTEQGRGTQALVYLKPQAGAAVPLIPTGSTQLATYQPTLPAPVEVPANKAPGVIGWGGVQTDGLGVVIGSGFSDVNRVFLAFHAGKSVADFNAKDTFLKVEQADRLWQAAIAKVDPPQRSIDLGNLESASGEAFSQFDLAPGAWIFGAMCDYCNNPAMIVTALQPVTN